MTMGHQYPESGQTAASPREPQLIRAYNVIDEDETSVTYQYNSLCSYWLYLSAAIFAVGFGTDIFALTIAGLALLMPYFLVVYFPALKDARDIRAAIRDSSAELKGSRWSVSNPLQIRIQRDGPGRAQP